ncbi:MAG: response regulator [Bdellovibrionota bacterium]
MTTTVETTEAKNSKKAPHIEDIERHSLNTEKVVKKVLIVEDDQAFRPFWEKVFQPYNAKIDWATTSEGAEELIRLRFKKRDPYDLVISDIFLEGEGSGIDLWNRYGEETLNFIFVSGLPLSKYDLLMTLNFGCPIYLKKPLSIQSCREIVNNVLTSNEENE